MGNVIFARPRHDYDSYRDLYRLIELNGYALIYADEIQPDSDNTYIVTILNGETQNGWPASRARIILYDLEYHMDGLPELPGIAEVWTHDAWYARCIHARYVPLGGDKRLNPEPHARSERHYDAALLAYMVGRRQGVADQLRERGMSLAPNGWFDERHTALLGTRAMLHVHQHAHIPAVAAQRFVLAAAYGLPLFTETLADGGIFALGKVLESDLPHYADFVAMWLADKSQRLADYAFALSALLNEQYQFRKVIEGAV